jgi:hypothetical protein
MVIPSLVPDEVEIAEAHRMVREPAGIHKMFMTNCLRCTGRAAGTTSGCGRPDLSDRVSDAGVQVLFDFCIHFVIFLVFFRDPVNIYRQIPGYAKISRHPIYTFAVVSKFASTVVSLIEGENLHNRWGAIL